MNTTVTLVVFVHLFSSAIGKPMDVKRFDTMEHCEAARAIYTKETNDANQVYACLQGEIAVSGQ